MGSAFIDPNAKNELYTIASDPKENQVFQVENFNALEKIRESLQAKLFAIEGIVIYGFKKGLLANMSQNVNLHTISVSCMNLI